MEKELNPIHIICSSRELMASLNAKVSSLFNQTDLNSDLVAVELYKTNVKLFKPIYCGMSILGMYALFFFHCFACFDKRTISIFNQSIVRIKKVS